MTTKTIFYSFREDGELEHTDVDNAVYEFLDRECVGDWPETVNVYAHSKIEPEDDDYDPDAPAMFGYDFMCRREPSLDTQVNTLQWLKENEGIMFDDDAVKDWMSKHEGKEDATNTD